MISDDYLITLLYLNGKKIFCNSIEVKNLLKKYNLILMSSEGAEEKGDIEVYHQHRQ